jgi:prolyl-tRNA synthetase
MLDVYATFAEEYIAVPVLKGLKTEKEKFAGAHHTYCIEGLMQDGKALQAGTSHHLGQNFAKAFDVKFQTETGDWQHAFNTSWGVSTRLVGAVVMAHGDDNGLVLPPRLAPIQVVIVPIFKSGDPVDRILAAARGVEETLKKAGVAVKLDARDNLAPGFKFHDWELAGVPLRIELGPKDLEKGSVCCVKRLGRAKSFVPAVDVAKEVPRLLHEIQAELLAADKARRDASTHAVDTYDVFKLTLEGSGGFLLAHWCGETNCETAIHEETKATVRVITFDGPKEAGACVRCGNPSARRVHFAKAY